MDELLPVEPVRPPSTARRRFRIAVTLVLLAAFVVVAGLEGSGFIMPAQPTPPAQPAVAPPTPALAPTPARLAYVGLDGSLHSMDAAGDRNSVIRFPSPGEAFKFPAWSPDGTRIAAISTDDMGTHLDVFTPPVDGGNADAPAGPTTVYQSTARPVFYLYWAPDSRAIAFLTTEPGGIALRRAPADASAPATVVRTGAPMYWQWVDPSRLLVHSGGEAADAFAGLVALDGTPDDSVALDPGSFRAPAMSPDGNYLASTATQPDGARSVVVASRDGTVRHDVPVFGLAAVDFAPAGDTLAFIAAAVAGTAATIPVGPLRVVDPATGAVRTLIAGSIVTFFWAPDGRTIAALGIPEPGDTKTASVDTTTDSVDGASVTLALARPAGVDTAAGTMLRMIFVDAASGVVRSERATRVSDLFTSQVLPFFDQYALSHRFWSPDSRSLVLPVDDDQGLTRITSFYADGSDPIALVDGEFASWSR